MKQFVMRNAFSYSIFTVFVRYINYDAPAHNMKIKGGVSAIYATFGPQICYCVALSPFRRWGIKVSYFLWLQKYALRMKEYDL